MKLFAVCLIHCYFILLSSEYLNLELLIMNSKTNMTIDCTFLTSSTSSGPLRKKFPCLVTDIKDLVSSSTVTASSLSVFWKIIYGIQILLTYIELSTIFKVVLHKEVIILFIKSYYLELRIPIRLPPHLSEHWELQNFLDYDKELYSHTTLM